MLQQRSISVKLDSTDTAVTHFPGVAPLANLADRLGILSLLDSEMPRKERNRGYANSAAVFDMMSIPLSGGECIDDLNQLRMDEGLVRLLGRRPMASSTAHDFLRRNRYDGLEPLSAAQRLLLNQLAHHTGTTTATIDVDASLFASGGRHARMSYKGEKGYMPMLAFWDELGVAVYDDFRNGNTTPGADALSFLQQTLLQLPKSVHTINIRSDSAWYQAGLLDYCQENGYGFCIGADQDEAVKAATMAMEERDWQPIHLCSDPDDPEPCVREWACETVHTLNKSDYAYRLILIRKERLQDDLFYGPYRYHAIITNMDIPTEQQIAWYRRRGQCENLIKELKWDFELRCLPSGDFFVNALYFRIIMLAYNLFVALKLMVLPEPYRTRRLKRLSYQLLCIPALVVYHARRLYLKLPRGHPHAAAFCASLA